MDMSWIDKGQTPDWQKLLQLKQTGGFLLRRMWTCSVLRSDQRIELWESDKVYIDKYFSEMRDSYKNKDAAVGPNASFTRITNGEVECFSRNTKLALLLTEHSTRMMSHGNGSRRSYRINRNYQLVWSDHYRDSKTNNGGNNNDKTDFL